MSSESERDRSTDALLRAALPGLPEGEAPACLDAETLASWTDRSLPAGEMARADAHLAKCSRCQALLAAFVRTEPAAAAHVPFWQRGLPRWLVPVSAAAAAAVILGVVIRDTAPPPADLPKPVEMARLDMPAPASPPPPTPAPGPAPAPASPRDLRDGAESQNGSARLERSVQGSVRGANPALPGVAAGLAAPSAPPARAEADAEAERRSADAGASAARPVRTALPGTPAPASSMKPQKVVDQTAAAQPSEKLDSVQLSNVALDQNRTYEAVAPTTVQGSRPDAVVLEIASAPRQAFGRSGGRGGGVRGPESARAAGADAAAASKLPATIPARWRVLADGRVERSINAGATWHPVDVDVPVPLTAGMSPSDLVCWLVGPNGAVLLSVDGASFTRIPFPEPAPLVSVTAPNERAATIRTADGRTFVTGNGGASWTQP